MADPIASRAGFRSNVMPVSRSDTFHRTKADAMAAEHD
jgi:hypothetical protein